MKPNDVSMSGAGVPKEGRYIITFKNGKSKENFIKDRNKNNKIKKNFGKQAALAAILTDAEVTELSASSEILYVEPDSNVEMLSHGKPDKADKAVKNMDKHGQTVPWGIASIGAAATLHKYDGKKVKVAVFDTGVSNHEDLEISGGVSFVDYTDSYSDDNGHGTHVAGTIAAKNNKLGVVGVAPDAEIYAVKILDSAGRGSYSGIIAALEWAVDNGIEIINMSLGSNQFSSVLHVAIKYAVEEGIIIVAAAGNQGEGEDTVMYPAKYPEVVAVGAVTEEYKAANFSSRGLGINIVAPGAEVLSTLNDGEYASMSGTSMAAPHVSGALAALKSKNKKFGSNELINRIYETATPLGDYSTYGCGFLNFAYAAGEIDGAVISVSNLDMPIYDNEINADTDETSENVIIYPNEKFIVSPEEKSAEIKECEELRIYIDYMHPEDDFTMEKYPEPILQESINNSENDFTANATASITVSNITATTASFSIVFPNSQSPNNYMYFYDTQTWQNYDWVNDIPRVPDAAPNTKDGSYNVADLVPNTVYKIVLKYYDDSLKQWQETVKTFTTAAYTGSDVSKNTGGKITYTLPGYMNNLITQASMTNADTAFDLMQDLVGTPSSLGNSFNVGTSGSLGTTEGGTIVAVSGNPIKYVEGFFNEHLLFLTKKSNTILRVLLHEMGHNFDSPRWNFEPECLAELKTAYVFEKGNHTFTQGRLTYSGSNVKNFYKTHPIYGYDDSVANNQYNCWGLVYNILKIKDTIGWEPFKQTFRFFNSLATGSVPTTNIGKFNMFLTKLRDFSPAKTDVIAMFTPQEKSVYEGKIGGTMAYYTGTVNTDDHSNDIWDGTWLTLDIPMNGVINYAGDIDCFRFKPATTGRYIVASGGSTPLTLEGFELLQNGSCWSKFELFTDAVSNFKKVFDFTAGTTYMFKVKHTNVAAASGDYTITVKKDDGSVDDHSNSIWEGTELELNVPMSGKINYAGDIDCFKFTAPETGKYIIVSGGNTPLAIQQMWKSVSGGASGISPQFSDAASNFKKVYAFEKGAMYMFGVAHTNTSATSGDYTITVKKDDGSIDDHPNEIWEGTMLTLDIPMPGKINYAGDIDCFRFIPPTTDEYMIVSVGTPLVLQAVYELLLGGSAQGKSAVYTYSSCNFQKAFTLTAGTTYMFKVAHISNTASSKNYEILITKGINQGDQTTALEYKTLAVSDNLTSLATPPFGSNYIFFDGEKVDRIFKNGKWLVSLNDLIIALKGSGTTREPSNGGIRLHHASVFKDTDWGRSTVLYFYFRNNAMNVDFVHPYTSNGIDTIEDVIEYRDNTMWLGFKGANRQAIDFYVDIDAFCELLTNVSITPTITYPVTSISINSNSRPTDNTILTGTSHTGLSVNVNPSNATNKAVTWSSSNPNVATINSSTGVITAVGSGKTIIKATANDNTNNASVSFELNVTTADLFIQTTVWNYLINKGFTKQQVAGIMGNAMQESGWNPLRRGGSSQYWGLFQIGSTGQYMGVAKHLAEELHKKYAEAGLDVNAYGYNVSTYQGIGAQSNIPSNDLRKILAVQLDFVYDCRPTSLDWITPLKSATSVEEAAEVFLVRFEGAVSTNKIPDNMISYFTPFIGAYYQETKKRRDYALYYYGQFS